MKKILLFFAALLLIVSCSKFDETTVAPPLTDETPVEEAVSEYAVSVDDALAALDIALKSIDGADTRSSDARRVRSVKALKARDVLPATRTEQLPDVEDMFYIVSFDEGEGSAVLGADTRLEGIYAILDETELTPADFVATATRSDAGDGEMRYVATEEELRQFVTSCITSAAYRDLITPKEEEWIEYQDSVLVSDKVMETVAPRGGGDLPGIIKPITPVPNPPIREQTYVYENSHVDPMLRTKWTQSGGIYNGLCFENGVMCYAGCVPIAAAQLIYHNATGTITFDGKTFDCLLLNQFRYDYVGTQTYDAMMEVARYIREIGLYLDVDYGEVGSGIGTSGYLSDIADLLLEVGYNSASYESFDYDNTKYIIETLEKPFVMSGGKASGKGHAWVIDGWNSYVSRTYQLVYNPNLPDYPPYDSYLVSSTTIQQVHANMGWNGKCDGYYTYNLFDVSQRLDPEDIATDYGDYAGTNGDSVYDRAFYYIEYRL